MRSGRFSPDVRPTDSTTSPGTTEAVTAATDGASLRWLHDSLKHTVGEREAGALMQLVPAVPCHNLVTKDYFDTQLEARLANMVTNDHLDARLAGTDAKLERAFRSQMVWLIATIITFNGALAAFFTLAH